jgi:hypothetical protein
MKFLYQSVFRTVPPPTPSITPQGWTQPEAWPSRVVTPKFPVTEQQFSSFAPAGQIASFVFPTFNPFDAVPLKAKQPPIGSIQFSAFSGVPFPPPIAGSQAFFDSTKIKPFPIVAQQFSTFSGVRFPPPILAPPSFFWPIKAVPPPQHITPQIQWDEFTMSLTGHIGLFGFPAPDEGVTKRRRDYRKLPEPDWTEQKRRRDKIRAQLLEAIYGPPVILPPEVRPPSLPEPEWAEIPEPAPPELPQPFIYVGLPGEVNPLQLEMNAAGRALQVRMDARKAVEMMAMAEDELAAELLLLVD